MPEDNNPQGTVADEPSDFLSGVDAITDMLDDSDLDPNTGENGEAKGAKAKPEPDEDEGDELESDAGEEDADADDDAEDAEITGEDEDESDADPESSQGRFVAHDAKVRLSDGTVTTVGELARSPLFQSDYTRKTQELADERKSVDRAKEEITGYAQQLRQERDFLFQIAQQFIPQEPDPKMMAEDFIGYHETKAEYEQRMKVVEQLRQSAMEDHARQQQELAAQQQERLNTEAAKLVEAMPELKKPGAYEQFWASTVDVMSAYGFSPQELEQAIDHRYFKVFRDLMKYRKAKANAGKVRDDMKSKPMLKSGKRMDVNQKTSREKADRAARARKTGSIEDAVPSIMDLI